MNHSRFEPVAHYERGYALLPHTWPEDIYVVAELFGVVKRFKAPEIVIWGVILGFLIGCVTNLVVTFGGA